MIRSRAQHNRPLRLSRRAVGLALVLALVSLQQAWAAAFCLCDDQSRMQAQTGSCESHQTAPVAEHHAGMHHHPDAEMPHGGMRHNASQASQSDPNSESVSKTGGEPRSHHPSTLSCCHVQPQADVPAASISFQPPSLEGAQGLPQFALGAGETLPAASIPKPPRSRPVYLTVSAFLI